MPSHIHPLRASIRANPAGYRNKESPHLKGKRDDCIAQRLQCFSSSWRDTLTRTLQQAQSLPPHYMLTLQRTEWHQQIQEQAESSVELHGARYRQ
jgi:hypothetical protein